MTASRLQPLRLYDFTGGLNLVGDAYRLADNESPELRNVDITDGGVRSRRGWTDWSTSALGAVTWDPTRLHVFAQPSGAVDVVLVNDGDVFTSVTGAFTQLSDAGGPVVAAADGHGADFADWGADLYMACGRTQQARKWTGSGNATKLTASAAGAWQDSYTAPVGGHFPKAEFATTYAGYMVTAYTNEDGTDRPNRVRFSHPNAPTDWKQTDYVDIDGGGSHITGLVAFEDHVVVFKTNSVWAIYGYDAASFSPVNLTPAVGAVSRNAIAVAHSSCFFYSHPDGVHEYRPGQGLFEVSQRVLRPIIDSDELNENRLDEIRMGYLNRRLWVSVPYEKGAVPTTPRSTFVYDPRAESWTLYNDADGDGLGCFATGGTQGDGALLLAAHPVHQRVLRVEANDTAIDTIDGAAAGFPTAFATKWHHAGWPALRKSWRRPDYIVTEHAATYDLTVEVRRDYEEGSPRSTHTVTVETGSTSAVWGTFVWGTDLWGSAPSGAHVERGGSIGLARAVQLRFSGTVGKPWGLNEVGMKYRSRRFR